MDAANVKAAPAREPQSITTQAKPTALKSAIKRAVCILALWGLITPKAATWMLRRWGLSHA